jgi:hypothetical protein
MLLLKHDITGTKAESPSPQSRLLRGLLQIPAIGQVNGNADCPQAWHNGDYAAKGQEHGDGLFLVFS